MKNKARHILWWVLGALVPLCASPLLIYVPPVQQWLVGQAATIASEATGLDISVERVSLGFPLDLSADGVLAVQEGDTIASVGRVTVDIGPLPLVMGKIAVNSLEMENADMNTLSLISDVQVIGNVGRLKLDPSKIQLTSGIVDLSDVLLSDADITILLSDTAQVDTTQTDPTPWRITFDKVAIKHTKVAIHLPGDSMLIGVDAGLLQANGGNIDLLHSTYSIQHTTWQEGRFVFDLPFEPYSRDMNHPTLLDYSHLDVDGIDWAVDSFLYQSPQIKMKVNHAAMRDISGLDITELKGDVTIDDQRVNIPWLRLSTPVSTINGKANVAYSFADSINPGQMTVDLDASVSKYDLAHFTGINTHTLPEWPLTLRGSIAGNTRHATFDIHQLSWPTVIEVEGSGIAENLADEKNLKAKMTMRVDTYDMQPLLTTIMGSKPSFAIPQGLRVQGRFNAEGQKFTANVAARHGEGTALVSGMFNQATTAYEANLTVSQLNMHLFLPDSKLRTLNAKMTAEGAGTDFFSPATWLDADGTISHLGYDTLSLDDMALKASLKNGHLQADLTTCNNYIDGNITFDATLKRENGQEWITSSLSSSVNAFDLYSLDITGRPLRIGFTGDIDMTTNMTDTYRLSGLVENIYLKDSLRTYHPEKVGVLLKGNADTTCVRAQSGTLIVKLDAKGAYGLLIDRVKALGDSIVSQLDRRVIDQRSFKQMLPIARLYVSSQQGNPMANMLKSALNTDFHDLLIDLNTSPHSGLNGQAHIYGLNADSTRIDTIIVTLVDKPEHGLTFQARVANNHKNPQFVFTALADGLLQEHGASIGLRFFDKKGEMGLRLGAKAEMEQGGMRFRLLPQRPTIGYREFSLNDDNFVFIQNNLRLQAKVDLLADNGTGIRVYSTDQDSTLLQDLTISLNNLDLERLTSTLPYVPRITGMLEGDYHLTMDRKKQISVASDMGIHDMTYEKCPMGTLQTEFVYLKREDGTHAVEGTLSQNGRDIAIFSGDYRDKKVTNGHEHLDGQLTLQHTPLNLLNGFIPDQIIGFKGYCDGDLSVVGSPSNPDVNGQITADSAYLISQPYGVSMRFDNAPINIQQSKIVFEEFNMYASNNNSPLSIQGSIDFSKVSDMTLDMRMRASDFMLINSKRTPKSIAYGKAFVNFFAAIRGPVDQLRVRGRLDVLGTTDLTYLLLDSPLSTDNQLDELVKFSDFNDTTVTHVVKRPTPEGLDMSLTINIAHGTHVLCGLNAAVSNYVDLFGGGELRMIYNNRDDLKLTGRYTLNSGEMKYSMPVIPLKTFSIEDGSYVEFTGDATNPTLNITATEHKMANVSEGSELTRSVAFDCGVTITNTLNNMGVKFIIRAPEDISVTNELNAMSEELRSKLAVTMLTTGMYLSDGNTKGFSMNAALSSFLESEINNITGNALKSVNISVGLDNSTDATGTSHTNYSFKFAKRFWNNRLKVQIGGKVSSGNEVQGMKESFFDNVSMEYRLSPTSNQYVKLFYNQNVYDWLDGYTSEYGGGYIWKRKLISLWDIFRPNAKEQQTMPMRRTTVPNDSTRTLRNDSIR